MDNKDYFYLSLRYIIALLVGIPNLYLIYALFTPLTVYPVYVILKLIYGLVILDSASSTIHLSLFSIKLIGACIAGAAYYLLLVLNLTTPMKTNLRVKSLLFLLFSFLILNIIRIIIFVALANNGFAYFDITHRIVWYFGSTVLLVIIWFVSSKIFKVKSIPVYTDINNLIKESNKKKKR